MHPRQAFAVAVEHCHASPELGGYAGRAPADFAGTQNDHMAALGRRQAAEHQTAASMVPMQERGSDMDGQPAGDFAHRGQYGKRSVHCDSFKSNRGQAFLPQHPSQFRNCRQMQEAEQQVVVA